MTDIRIAAHRAWAEAQCEGWDDSDSEDAAYYAAIRAGADHDEACALATETREADPEGPISIESALRAGQDPYDDTSAEGPFGVFR